MTRFADALLKAQFEDVGSNMQVLTFDRSCHLPDDMTKSSGLLVRDFYPRLFDNISTRKAALLTGVPGTGKSLWVWYAIQRLLDQDPPPAVLWESSKRTADEVILFKDGKAFYGSITSFMEELELESSWYVLP